VEARAEEKVMPCSLEFTTTW